jgi:3'(2'), 5'-bisphosphate nucleotidase
MFDELIPDLISLTSRAGDSILTYYKEQVSFDLKSDKTPLTIVDQISNSLIIDGLNSLTPDVEILSEESENISFEERSSWSEYWLIDPLDGTRDFLEETGEFCICIAYIKNNKSIFGMIYAPITKTHYYTDDNGNTFKQNNNTKKLLQVRKNNEILNVVVGRHSANNKKLLSHLKERNIPHINKLGSALKFCAIAEGLYDYYPRFGPCSEWDTAAGVCILEGAGGEVLDEKNNPLRYNTKSDLISPVFFASAKPE